MVTDLVQRSWKHRLGLTVVAGVLGVGLAAGVISLAQADPRTERAVKPAAGAVAPKVLSEADIKLYKQIVAAQQSAQWTKADALMAKLDNKLLLGHVYYQRLMAPNRRASYTELKDWMQHFADHPGAKTIYKLASSRQPAGAAPPEKPKVLAGRTPLPWASAPKVYRSAAARSESRIEQVANTRRTLIRLVDSGEPTNALSMLSQTDIDSQLDAVETDQIRQRIAAGYYHYGKIDQALAQAERAADRSGAAVPLAHWYAGLARWQKGDIAAAAPHFETLAHSQIVSNWMRSAGAYWAARAYLITLQPDKVVEMLEIGASNPRTFYGLLSIRALGVDFPFDWTLPALDKQRAHRLLKDKAVQRIVALKQLGQHQQAEQEMLHLYWRTNWDRDEDLVALANALDMPNMMYRIGLGSANYERLAQQGRTNRFPAGLKPRAYDAALYPMPAIAPKEGFTVDRALIYALIRQESKFVNKARSGDGARGLMQIMPATAKHVAKRTALSGDVVSKLDDPGYNLMVGQRYIQELLNGANYDGDLLRLAAAYNGGPGNLRKWSRRVNFGDDALLFLESLPSRETRMFIERVLTNYWMYRIQLGQETPSMDSLVAGDWPRYQAQDTKRIQLTSN